MYLHVWLYWVCKAVYVVILYGDDAFHLPEMLHGFLQCPVGGLPYCHPGNDVIVVDNPRIVGLDSLLQWAFTCFLVIHKDKNRG